MKSATGVQSLYPNGLVDSTLLACMHEVVYKDEAEPPKVAENTL